MASIGSSGGHGRRKSLDAELNLVPFIDLLSTCICFLLITAVWIQIGSIQIKQLVGTDASPAKVNSYELEVKFDSASKMNVNIIGSQGKNSSKGPSKFTVEGDSSQALISQFQTMMNGLGSVLHLNPQVDVKAQLGQLFSAARVTTKSGVPYGELVSVLDVIRDHGIINLGVVPVKE